MPAVECKKCNSAIEFFHGASVALCQTCGARQTLPKTSNEERIKQFDKANQLRQREKFDEAMVVSAQLLRMASMFCFSLIMSLVVQSPSLPHCILMLPLSVWIFQKETCAPMVTTPFQRMWRV